MLHIESLNYCTTGVWRLRKAETRSWSFQMEPTSCAWI